MIPSGHTDAVRALAVVDSRQFLSASNDAHVRRGSSRGDCLGTYSGGLNFSDKGVFCQHHLYLFRPHELHLQPLPPWERGRCLGYWRRRQKCEGVGRRSSCSDSLPSCHLCVGGSRSYQWGYCSSLQRWLCESFHQGCRKGCS